MKRNKEKLPLWDNAYVPPGKLEAYLLSETHAFGKFGWLRNLSRIRDLLLHIQSDFAREALKELDVVVLTHDLGKHNLMAGDVGTVVHIYHEGLAAEVEFVTGEGSTIAVITLDSTETRPMGKRDILHARELVA